MDPRDHNVSEGLLRIPGTTMGFRNCKGSGGPRWVPGLGVLLYIEILVYQLQFECKQYAYHIASSERMKNKYIIYCIVAIISRYVSIARYVYRNTPVGDLNDSWGQRVPGATTGPGDHHGSCMGTTTGVGEGGDCSGSFFFVPK